MSDETFAEHDGELGFCLGPFARRHFPFLHDLAQDQEISFVAATSLGKCPLARTARGSLGFNASIAFGVCMIFRTAGAKAKKRDDLFPLPPLHQI